jgi:acetyl esterase/lipase
MYRKILSAVTLFGLLLVMCPTAWSQEKKELPPRPQPDRKITYKEASGVELKLHLFAPEDWKPSDRRGAIVFFFGGGWIGGSPSQFYPHCRELADRGMVAMAADYRVRSRDQTTPFECVKDGKSAIRYVREHAGELGIDPDRLAAGGGSAGGHVAASTGTLPDFDEPEADREISSKPNAMVLFNPVVDTSERGYGYDRLRERFKEISPLHHIDESTPPTIIFHGTGDTIVPFSNVKNFCERMKVEGNFCELMAFEGRPHGFFNYGRGDNSDYESSLARMIHFLDQLGYLE